MATKPILMAFTLWKIFPSLEQISIVVLVTRDAFGSTPNHEFLVIVRVEEMDAIKGSNGGKYDCLLFDMDDTLYPMSSGLNLACRKNIEEYMVNHLQIEENKVTKMCLEFYKEYGTTMAGLKATGYEFDNDEFHAYVHGRLPYEFLKPDPVLRNLLLSVPQQKIIFTNADRTHAAQVLNRLGLEDCFEGIICFETLNPPSNSNNSNMECVSSLSDENPAEDEPAFCNANGSEKESGECTPENDLKSGECIPENNVQSRQQVLCKPSIEAMEAAIRIANIDPKKTVFFDDSTRNIAAGKEAGFHTVLVGSSVLTPGADIALNSIHNIKEALPEIWEGEEGEQVEATLTPTTVETAVTA
ncbi:hypothetical protein ACLOJK_015797 [Asimina triloba]